MIIISARGVAARERMNQQEKERRKNDPFEQWEESRGAEDDFVSRRGARGASYRQVVAAGKIASEARGEFRERDC